jgi:hypothetical protein
MTHWKSGHGIHETKKNTIFVIPNPLTRFRLTEVDLSVMSECFNVARADLAIKEEALSTRSTEFSERLRDMEKTMLMEIEKSRAESKAARQLADQCSGKYLLEAERLRLAYKEDISDLAARFNVVAAQNCFLKSEIATMKRIGATRKPSLSGRMPGQSQILK